MPRHSQSERDASEERRPPWPDQVTESQYHHLPDQMRPEDRAHQAYSETGGPEVSGLKAGQFEQSPASEQHVSSPGSAETAQGVGENIRQSLSTTSRAAAEKASALANTAASRARSMAIELESFTRRKPFSALASAFLAGIALMVLGRRRRS
jgi:ElaB/YqjD/DUF883 family membrane-anchored ribosome-binding protein